MRPLDAGTAQLGRYVFGSGSKGRLVNSGQKWRCRYCIILYTDQYCFSEWFDCMSISIMNLELHPWQLICLRILLHSKIKQHLPLNLFVPFCRKDCFNTCARSCQAGRPTKMPVALVDLLAAHQLKEAGRARWEFIG